MRRDPEEICLLHCLRSRGLLQGEVAQRLGVSAALVSLWANGKRRPGPARMAALRQLALDTPFDSARQVDARLELPP
jgi:transcriptional regulator with XRE-family HTH domain